VTVHHGGANPPPGNWPPELSVDRHGFDASDNDGCGYESDWPTVGNQKSRGEIAHWSKEARSGSGAATASCDCAISLACRSARLIGEADLAGTSIASTTTHVAGFSGATFHNTRRDKVNQWAADDFPPAMAAAGRQHRGATGVRQRQARGLTCSSVTVTSW
jgi:hypothetical protein